MIEDVTTSDMIMVASVIITLLTTIAGGIATVLIAIFSWSIKANMRGILDHISRVEKECRGTTDALERKQSRLAEKLENHGNTLSSINERVKSIHQLIDRSWGQ